MSYKLQYPRPRSAVRLWYRYESFHKLYSETCNKEDFCSDQSIGRIWKVPALSELIQPIWTSYPAWQALKESRVIFTTSRINLSVSMTFPSRKSYIGYDTKQRDFWLIPLLWLDSSNEPFVACIGGSLFSVKGFSARPAGKNYQVSITSCRSKQNRPLRCT